MNGHVVGGKTLCRHRQEGRRDVLVHEQALGGVAHARALAFRVDEDVFRHFEVGGGVHVNVAVAGAGFDDGDGRVHDDRLNKTCAAARNENVQIAVQLHHLRRGLAGGVLNEVDGVFGQAAGSERPAHDAGQAHRGAERLLAAAQDAGRACLEAEHSRVHGNVRTGLVDDADDAHRDALLTDIQAVRTPAHPEHLAHRVGERRDLTAALRDAGDALFVQHQAVDEAVVQTGGTAVFDVDFVCRDDFVRVRDKRICDGENSAVFVICAEFRNRILSAACILGDFKKLTHWFHLIFFIIRVPMVFNVRRAG